MKTLKSAKLAKAMELVENMEDCELLRARAFAARMVQMWGAGSGQAFRALEAVRATHLRRAREALRNGLVH